MPDAIISSVTEPPAPTPRGIGQIIYRILTDRVDEAGNFILGDLTPGLPSPPGSPPSVQDGIDVEKYDINTILINATVRYAPERFPGALPEIDIVLDRVNRSFRLRVIDTTQQNFGGGPTGG